MHTTPPIPDAGTLKTWSRDEYYRLADCGWFQDERTELIGGRIYIVSPQKSRHFWVMEKSARRLEQIFGAGYWVRRQGPLSLSESSEPEPDIAVVAGDFDNYDSDPDHPTTASLIVEVSNTTLAFDRSDKASLYASFGIEDYWIINLVDRVLEVRRDPAVDDQQPFGHTYRSVRTLQPTDTISPLAAPDSAIPVNDLLSSQEQEPSDDTA